MYSRKTTVWNVVLGQFSRVSTHTHLYLGGARSGNAPPIHREDVILSRTLTRQSSPLNIRTP